MFSVFCHYQKKKKRLYLYIFLCFTQFISTCLVCFSLHLCYLKFTELFKYVNLYLSPNLGNLEPLFLQAFFSTLILLSFFSRIYICSVQFSSVTQSCPILCDPMNRSTPGLPVHHQLLSSLKLTSIESVMPSSHLILCHPLLLLPAIPPSIRVFPNESTLHIRWPKYWSFSFSIIPSKEHPGLISFRMN